MKPMEGAETKDTNHGEKGASVIICCYNSASRICNTLDFLLRQETAGVPVEILLIDNNSTDGCAQLAADHWKAGGNPFPFRTINEPQQGLSYARQRGINESRYDTLVFCDDDNLLEKDFIAHAFHVFREHPDAAVLGGRIDAVYETQPPAWLKDYEGFLAVGSFPREGDITGERPFVPGAGLVLRKTAYLRLVQHHFQFICSDRKGSRLSSGGDTELCMALVLAGGRVYYSSALRLGHFIPAGRTTWEYICRLIPAIAAATVVLNIYRREINGEPNGRIVLWRQAFSAAKFVLHPAQARAFRKAKGGPDKHQLNYARSKETLRQLVKILLTPGYFHRISKQVRRLHDRAAA